MHLRISRLYVLLVIITMIFGLVMFPVYHENVQIPLVPLIGLGSWIFGRRTGLILILPIMIYSYFLSSVFHADIYVYYEAKGGGIIIMAATAILIGNIRSSYDALKTANINLDQRVEKRNTELKNLTAQLLNDAEANRLRNGQTLHDGIGQLLTGIQLYCSSLAEQLRADTSPIVSLVYSMREKTEKAHTVVRKTARMLFPIRMHETGLIPAIKELTSCFDEMEHISVLLKVDGDFREIPEEVALGLYRICHESAMCAATALNAHAIHLGLNEDATGYQVTLQHNGAPWSHLTGNMEQRLILYRLQALRGTFSSDQSANGFETIIYRIPKV